MPEVWRYDVPDRTLWLGRLVGDRYGSADRSPALPRLTPALVLHALDVFDEGEMGEDAWQDWIRAWARDLPGPPAA